MHGISSRQLSIPRTICFACCTTLSSTAQHPIYYAEQCVKSRLNWVAAIDGDIPVQNFLQYLGIGNKMLTVGDQFLEQTLCVSFVTMRCADQINRPASCCRMLSRMQHLLEYTLPGHYFAQGRPYNFARLLSKARRLAVR